MKFLAFLHCRDFKSNYSHMLGPYNLVEIDFQRNFLLCISSPISSKIKAPTIEQRYSGNLKSESKVLSDSYFVMYGMCQTGDIEVKS